MAKGRKTGGRNFKKGQGGRKKGAKDKVPRGLKAKLAGSIKSMYEAVVIGEPDLVLSTIRRGFKGGGTVGFHHVQLAGHYLDGRPAQTVNMNIDLTKYTSEQLAALRALIAVGTGV